MTMKPAVAMFEPKAQMRRRSSSAFNQVKKYQESAAWLPEARQAILELEHLPQNWDSYGSAKIQPAAIRAAIRFLFEAPSRLVPCPHISPTPGGGIGFHWLVAGRDLEIEFTGEGAVEFLKSYPGSDRDPEEGAIREDDDYVVLKWVVGRV
jgi:hypothetical protein